MKRRLSILLTGAISVSAAPSVSAAHNNLRHKKVQRTLQDNPNNYYCGVNWQVAYDNCNTPCPSAKDEECGPGATCFGFVDCTPPEPEPVPEPVPVPAPTPLVFSQPSVSTTTTTNNNNDGKVYSEIFLQPVPTYIASLPVRPSEPTTPAPFSLPPPTPNLMANPTNNFCGYGWEGARDECYYSCPSGLDKECEGGRTCHSWMSCTPAKDNPAIYNVCGTSWGNAAKTCATRCFFGDDESCPDGQQCYGAVTDCKDKLPELTAVDVGLEERSYTIEEVEILLQEELKKEADEIAMNNPDNWWCGTSWSNMLEKCEKRCETDEDCKPNSWTEGFCYRTTGGPENCRTPGVGVKAAAAPGSRWCGTSWNNMLETCAAMCESDEDCNGGQCYEAPGTCQWIGHPVKEKAKEGTLWCGSDFSDAKTSCHKECPR